MIDIDITIDIEIDPNFCWILILILEIDIDIDIGPTVCLILILILEIDIGPNFFGTWMILILKLDIGTTWYWNKSKHESGMPNPGAEITKGGQKSNHDLIWFDLNGFLDLLIWFDLIWHIF